MSSILVFGEKGQLASSLKELRPGLLFIGQKQLDLQKVQGIAPLLDQKKPRLIINTSAYTAVDKAETEKDAADRLNHLAPKEMAQWCRKNGAKLIHISTDYVFDGQKSSAYLETDPVSPVNYYGLTKQLGEDAILKSGCEAMIFRTSWVYSPFGNNFLKTMLRLGKEREVLSVVSDQYGAPTYALDLAKALLKVADRFVGEPMGSLMGIYNLTNSGETTWHGFAAEIFSEARKMDVELKVKDLKAIATRDYPTPARRPHNSRLSSQKAINHLSLSMPAWNHGIQDTLRRLNAGSGI